MSLEATTCQGRQNVLPAVQTNNLDKFSRQMIQTCPQERCRGRRGDGSAGAGELDCAAGALECDRKAAAVPRSYIGIVMALASAEGDGSRDRSPRRAAPANSPSGSGGPIGCPMHSIGPSDSINRRGQGVVEPAQRGTANFRARRRGGSQTGPTSTSTHRSADLRC
jgi:hypothetical protein